MLHFELNPTRIRSPWNTASQLDREFEKIFDAFSKTDTIAPPCEITDEEKFYTVSIDIPGINKDDLDIEVKDDHLYITGERKLLRSDSGKENVLRSERRYGKFSRVFTLPKNVKTDAIEARFENGVLEIALPKEEKAQPKKITISTWSKEASEQKKLDQ